MPKLAPDVFRRDAKTAGEMCMTPISREGEQTTGGGPANIERWASGRRRAATEGRRLPQEISDLLADCTAGDVSPRSGREKAHRSGLLG